MAARLPAWIWCLVPSILSVINLQSCVALAQDDNNKNMSTEHFQPAVPTERPENLTVTSSVAGRNSSDQNIDSKAILSGESTAMPEYSTGYDSNDSTNNYTATTNFIYSNNTVIPLTTAKPHEYDKPTDVTEPKEYETVIPITKTDNYFNDLETTEDYTTVKSINQIKDYQNYDFIKHNSTSNFSVDSVVSPSEKLSSKEDNGTVNSFNNSSNNIGYTLKNQHAESQTPIYEQISREEKNDIDDLFNNTYNHIDSNEHVTPNETKQFFEPSTELAVIGISNLERHIEKMMILNPSKVVKNVWLMSTIHNMLDHTMLKRETEDYIIQLHQRYEYLPLVEADNYIWTKFSRAVVENFVLDFCKNYPNYSDTERSIARWYKIEEYNSIYNMTLRRLQEKKGQTAVQFAAPIRRATDIYKAILSLPIGIVQSKCQYDMVGWLCPAQYLVGLVDFSVICEQAWYHAQVHLAVLQSLRQVKGAKDPASEVIAELDARISSLDQNNHVDYLFDFIIQTLDDLRKRLKESLLEQASLYNLVRKLQSEDKLKCLIIDDQGL